MKAIRAQLALNAASLVSDETHRIAREGFAIPHEQTKARRIAAELTRGETVFRGRIGDDGVQIDHQVLEYRRAAGHRGLQGREERAGAFGATVDVWREHGAGTEIEFAIPAIACRRGTDRASSSSGRVREIKHP
jgi:nitrate/nitrite-specific signal transduction histidine kinase